MNVVTEFIYHNTIELVVILQIIQICFVIWGMYRQFSGLLIMIDDDQKLAYQTVVTNIEEGIGWAFIIPIYFVLFPFIAWHFEIHKIPTDIIRILYEWEPLGTLILVVFSVKIGMWAAGYLYIYIWVIEQNMDPQLIYILFVPSILSAFLYTLLKNRNLAALYSLSLIQLLRNYGRQS